MRFFKYLFLFTIGLFSTYSIAEEAVCYNYYIKNQYVDTGLHPTPQSACTALIGKNVSAGVITGSVLKNGLCYIDGQGFSNSAYYGPDKKQVECKNECPKDRRKNFSFIVPNDSTMPPDLVCDAGCEFNMDGNVAWGMQTENGNFTMVADGGSNGQSCQNQTDFGKDTPQAKCVNEKGSDEYCKKPESGCPSGYKEGTFNSEAYCFKKDPDEPPASNPDPDNPPSSNPDPNEPPASGPPGQGDNSCNGTNNCNTSNFDDKNIVKAIKDLNSAISGIGDKITSSISESGSKLKNAIDGTTESVNNMLAFFKDGLDSKLPENEKTAVPEQKIEVTSLKENIFSSSAQCPAPKRLAMNVLGRSFSYQFDFSELCKWLGILGSLILIAAYIYASNIVLRS